MRAAAQRLIAEELHPDDPSDTRGLAAFRVCEKLRRPLTTFAGAVGFRSLLSRAHTLAKAEVPWLAGLKIKADGSFEFPAGIETLLALDEKAQGGIALIAQLLGLLVTFIGEALTLRLLHDVWPKAAFKNLESRRN